MQALPEHPNYKALGFEFSQQLRDFAYEHITDPERREAFGELLDKLGSRVLGHMAVFAGEFMDSEEAQELMVRNAEERCAGRFLGKMFGRSIDEARPAGAGYFAHIDWPSYKDVPGRVVAERNVGTQVRTHIEYEGEHVLLVRQTAPNGHVSAWAVLYGPGQSASVAVKNSLASEVATNYYDMDLFKKAAGVPA